ncbi:MAG: tetratricopeptide repeat protein [Gammaproteobacteria bacterium]|nr:tetratricopeptide repeat protein [Gammaproteobacteria bacterium]
MAHNDVNALMQQLTMLFHQGNLMDAQQYAMKILSLSPGHTGAMQLLGGIKANFGDYQSAFDLFSTLVKLDPGHPGGFNNLAYVLHMMGRLDEARQAGMQAIRLKPDFVEAHNTLAVILKDLGNLEQALMTIQRAIQLQHNFIEAYNTCASILVDMRRFEDALSVCQRALQSGSAFVEVHNLQVIALIGLGRVEQASVVCEQAIRQYPDSFMLYDTRSNLLNEQGLMQASLIACNKAIELNLERAASYYNRGNVLGNLARFDEAEADYRKAIALDPKYAEAHSNLLFVQASAATLSFPEMLQQQQQWDQVHGEQGRLYTLAARPIKKEPGERLRVGYMSGDFCMHPVSYFLEPLLAGHDKTGFEIFCYANMYESQADKVTARLRDLSEHWRFVRDKDDAELVRLIQQDGIDILIDLAGHTRGNRLKVFTWRPAAIQAMYLGYCASSGLQAMDYWITDEVLHPADTAELATETIIRLPRCSFCYQPPQEADITVSRIDDGKGIVFASYSHFSKLLPAVIALWSKILTQVAGSRLMIMDKYMADKGTRKVLIDQFKSYGIGDDRLIIKSHLSYIDYYKSYAEIDIVLDPFPRTGGTTTADALWMGVPVVTLAGARYVERISASKLHALALDDLVADDCGQYLDIAVRLAGDEGYRQDLRKGLRQRMMQSQLCDSRGLASGMEIVYREMYSSIFQSTR